MSFLKDLPYPNILEELSFEECLKDIETVFKECLNTQELKLLESDNYKALLESLAYRELIVRARINNSIKAMLLPYAKGSDLDNVVAIYGIKRLQGDRPSCIVEFSLSSARQNDTLIPKGLVLSDDVGSRAFLKDDVVIEANSLKASGKVLLDEFVENSSKKCEYIQTALPYVLKAKQLSSFEAGANVEDDERLRQRAVLSLKRFSTAGSKNSYIYHALSVSPKVLEVEVLNGGAGVVNIYIKSEALDEELKNDVLQYLSDKKHRPLTDNVFVFNATKVDVEVVATLELVDMFREDEISKKIQKSKKSLSLGEDLNLSYLYSILHQSGVYRVNLSSPVADLKVEKNEFVSLSFNLSFTRANL